MDNTSLQPSTRERRMARIALALLLLVVLLSFFSVWQTYYVLVFPLIPKGLALEISKPYLISGIVGTILIIQAAGSYRRKQFRATYLLGLASASLLFLWIVLCRLGFINP